MTYLFGKERQTALLGLILNTESPWAPDMPFSLTYLEWWQTRPPGALYTADTKGPTLSGHWATANKAKPATLLWALATKLRVCTFCTGADKLVM